MIKTTYEDLMHLKLDEFEKEIIKSAINLYFYKAIKEAGKWEDKGLMKHLNVNLDERENVKDHKGYRTIQNKILMKLSKLDIIK
jgi:hypothetical protein